METTRWHCVGLYPGNFHYAVMCLWLVLGEMQHSTLWCSVLEEIIKHASKACSIAAFVTTIISLLSATRSAEIQQPQHSMLLTA